MSTRRSATSISSRTIPTSRSAISISRSDHFDTEVRDLDIKVGASRHRGPRSRYRGWSISTPTSAISISRSEHVNDDLREVVLGGGQTILSVLLHVSERS